MINDFVAFGSAIYSRLSTGTVNAYNTLAPQGSAAPYVIFQRQDAQDEHTFSDGGAGGVVADYAIKVVSSHKFIGEAQALYGPVHTLMQDASLTATGLNFIRCRRTSTLSYRDPDGYWHVGGIYRIEAWAS